MALYSKIRSRLKKPTYSIAKSPREKRLAALKDAQVLSVSMVSMTAQVFAKINAPGRSRYIVGSIRQALGYLGVFLDTAAILVANKLNAQQKLDFLFGLAGFFVMQANTMGGIAIDSAWKVLRQLPFLIGMFLADNEQKKEKLSLLTTKNARSATVGGIIGLGIAAIGLIIAPEVMVPLLITATIVTTLPLIISVVKKVVLPVCQYIFKETMTTILGKERYKKVGAAISEAAKTFVGAVKNLFGWDPPSDEKNITKLERVETTAQPLDTAYSEKTKKPYSVINTAKLFDKAASFAKTVTLPKKKPEESFDYFKYVVKEKRSISVLLQDVVLHRKQLEQLTQQEATFFARTQHEKHKDKVAALKLLETFLLQWQQLEKTQSAYDKTIPKAIILKEKNNHVVSIPFNDLVKDKEKLIKEFNDYLLEHHAHALDSILYRGKVETLISEAYAWIKRPTVADIEKEIDEYHMEYKTAHDEASSPSIAFLSELLRKTHDMLYDHDRLDIVACDVQGLVLTRDELVDATKLRELYEKIEGFAVRAYPEFAASYQSRGEMHAIFRSIINHIYFYEANPEALAIVPKSVTSIAP